MSEPAPEWKPLVRIPDDPAVHEALARELMAIIVSADDPRLHEFFMQKVQALKDIIVVVQTALQLCGAEEVHPSLVHVLKDIQRKVQVHSQKLEAERQQIAEAPSTLQNLEAALAHLHHSGVVPPDWRTREGDEVSVLLWFGEFWTAMKDSVISEKQGDVIKARLDKMRADEALETAMDRALTLSPASRDQLAPLVQQIYSGRREVKAREQR